MSVTGDNDFELSENNVLDLFNWDYFLHASDLDAPLVSDGFSPENLEKTTPDSVSSWIGEVENILMKADEGGEGEGGRDLQLSSQELCEDFLADVLVDSPEAVSTEKISGCSDRESEKKGSQKVNDDGAATDDPVSKKVQRKLRNRDAAVRSRQRRKMYVRDLELKSKYLEAECRRLGRMLECFAAENQALRLSLQKVGTSGVTSTKQESAVLLLESLLLGSLLWFLGIMCLFSLPPSTPVAVPQENEEVERVVVKNVEEARGAGSENGRSTFLFMNSRRCKASRTRIKSSFFLVVPIIYI